ncbi:hypothetical protein [Paenibacillus chibensis]|uniref:hypothetical protein n=1 Tax=Paenibacillus chibensis TaxID=59846 RepID=UPI0013E2C5BB|nr:hypothetical protein [Paenibacillus chibensis]
MLVDSGKLGSSLYCDHCGATAEQVHVWWKDGRNDDGLGFSQVFAECPNCHAELLHKDAYGEIGSAEDALRILQS